MCSVYSFATEHLIPEKSSPLIADVQDRTVEIAPGAYVVERHVQKVDIVGVVLCGHNQRNTSDKCKPGISYEWIAVEKDPEDWTDEDVDFLIAEFVSRLGLGGRACAVSLHFAI